MSHDLDAVLPDVDVVYLLRIQHERRNASLFPSLREYTARYGLTVERAARLRKDTLVMHPGPDEPRRRDRGRGRRGPGVAHHRAGHERRRGPHGRPLLAPRVREVCGCLSAADLRHPRRSRSSTRRGERDRRRARARRVTSSRSAPGLTRRRDARRVAAASSRPASSTSTCTCASRAWRRPRPSRPARAPPRSAGSPPSSRCRTPTPALDDPAVVASVLAAGEHARVRRGVAGCITKGRAGRGARADGGAARPRRADLHRRRRRASPTPA